MPNLRKEVKSSIKMIVPPINEIHSSKLPERKTKDVAVIEQNLMFLMHLSKEAELPITQYFLEKALESVLTIELNQETHLL